MNLTELLAIELPVSAQTCEYSNTLVTKEKSYRIDEAQVLLGKKFKAYL